MIKISSDQIIELIRTKKNLSYEEINNMIEQKLSQLSGLISREGAAHIVANELGISVYDEITTSKGDIRSLLPGMRNVELKGKITKINDTINFNTNNREGKVRSFRISDKTGSIRVVLWNDLVDKHKDLKENDVVEIKGAYVKQNQGYNELHITGSTTINKIEEDIKLEADRKTIASLDENDDNAEIMATIVQVFEPRFYEVCNQCGLRARESSGKYVCNKHGETNVDWALAVTTILDDGTSTIRSTFFKNQAARLVNISREEVLKLKDPAFFDEIKATLLGKTLVLKGKVKKNEALNNLEFVPLNVSEPDVVKELERVQQNIDYSSVENEKPIYKKETDEDEYYDAPEDEDIVY